MVRWLLPAAGGVAAALLVLAVERYEPSSPQAAAPAALNPVAQGAVGETLRRYNNILQDFYASAGRPMRLNVFPASTELRHQTFRDLGYLRDNELVLVLDLAEMEVGQAVELADGGVEVDVREEWNRVLQKAADRSPVDEIRGSTLRLRYHLKRASGGWQVIGWQPLPLRDAPMEPTP